MMREWKGALAVAGALAWMVQAAEPCRVYVSPAGDDRAAGSAEKPLRTLTAARDRVRAREKGRAAEVILLDGVYRLGETLELSAADGGTADAPVAWRAAHRGRAVLSGALPPAWRRPRADEVPATVPAAARAHLRVQDLPGDVPDFAGGGENVHVSPVSVFAAGRRLTCARWPREGFAHCSPRGDGAARTNATLTVAEQDAAWPDWARERNPWAYGLWKFEWDDRRLAVTAVDAAAKTFTVSGAANPYGFARGANFFLFNLACALDRPDTWYLDRAGKRLFVWTAGDTAEIALLPVLIRGRGLSHAIFEGLVLETVRERAVSLEEAAHVTLRASAIARTGGWGVWVQGGSHVRVEGCDFDDLGEGGVWLAGGDEKTLAPAGHAVDNCRIGRYGRVSPNYKPGVQLRGVGSSATHNLIYDSPHQGIAFNGNDHRIAFNVIHDTCTFNDDAGAVYCCMRDWTKIGTVIEHNLIHFTGKKPHATNTEAIYLDDWSSGVTVRGNILNRATQGVHVGGGQNCTVTGNVICAVGTAVGVGSRGAKSFAKATSSLGAKSGLYRRLQALEKACETSAWGKYPHLLDVLRKADPVKAHDPFNDVVAHNVLGGSGRVRVCADAADGNTVADNLETADDPGFVDYANLDFNLKPGSPAWRALGGNVRFDEMGLYASAARFSPPVRFAPSVTRNPPKPRPAHSPAKVRVDVVLPKKPTPEAPARAADLVNCEMPAWCRGERITAAFGTAGEDWRRERFSFVPACDGKAEICLMGAYGEKTLYDDFTVTCGARTLPPTRAGREGDAWRVRNSVERPPLGNIAPPYGVVEAAELGVTAAAGTRVGAANHERQLVRTIDVKKGERVSVAFKARDWNAAHWDDAVPGIDLKMRDATSGSAPFAPQGNAFSAAVRVKVEAQPRYYGYLQLVMSVGNGYNHGFRLELMPNRATGRFAPVLEIGVGPKRRAWMLASAEEAVVPGHWVTLAATWDGAVARLYADGREIAAAPYAGAYFADGHDSVDTGLPGEDYGVRSVPFVLDGARVWTRALAPGEVTRIFPAPPAEGDTPEVTAFLDDLARGACKTHGELARIRRYRHSPLARVALDRADALACLVAHDYAAAVLRRDAACAAMAKMPAERAKIAEYRSLFVQTALACGYAEAALEGAAAAYRAALSNRVDHLPYVALEYAQIAERAGRTREAANARAALRATDLSRFPHLARELGLPARFTAAPQRGATGHVVTAFGAETREVRTAADFVRVRDAIRARKRAGGLPAGGVTVRVRGGVYRLEKTFELTAEDSGTAQSPVVWCAAEGETPVIEGGFAVPADAAAACADARVPAGARANVLVFDVRRAGYDGFAPFEQYGYYVDPAPAVTELYQDGVRLEPARFPNAGWLNVAADGAFAVPAGLSAADLAKEPALALTGYPSETWADFTTAVTNVDVTAGTLQADLRVAHGTHRRYVKTVAGKPFFLHGALAFLDRPGEWHLDERTGLLYVWPLAGKGAPRFVLGRRSDVLWAMTRVTHVRVAGFVFQHGRFTGVTMTGCTNCVFAGNVVRRFGANGLEAHACGDCTFADNVFTTFGHGAAEVWGGVRKTLTPSGNVVANNAFAHVEKRRRTYAPCLHLDGVGTEVAFNHFHDAPSSAMRLEGNDFLIVSNLTENVLLESDDQGGVDIYCDASYFGNHYCFNTWKDIGRPNPNNTCGQAGVRFDGNISGQTVFGNRFVRCGTRQFGALQTCGGRLHVIDNNLFIDCNMGMSITHYPWRKWTGPAIRRLLAEYCLRRVCVTNEPFASRYPGIANLLETDQVNYLTRNVTVGNMSLVNNPPAQTVLVGNRHFATVGEMKRAARTLPLPPAPEESETGPRPTPRFLQARRNDATCP